MIYIDPPYNTLKEAMVLLIKTTASRTVKELQQLIGVDVEKSKTHFRLYSK